MNIRTTIPAAAVLLLALTACGSDDPADEPAADAGTTSAPTEDKPAEDKPADDSAGDAAALQTAVEDYTNAYFKGDADTAYQMLSKRCAGQISPGAYEAVVTQAATDFGPDHPATDVQADVSGDLARVSYKVKGLPRFDQQSQPWAREGGAWRYDAC